MCFSYVAGGGVWGPDCGPGPPAGGGARRQVVARRPARCAGQPTLSQLRSVASAAQQSGGRGARRGPRTEALPAKPSPPPPRRRLAGRATRLQYTRPSRPAVAEAMPEEVGGGARGRLAGVGWGRAVAVGSQMLCVAHRSLPPVSSSSQGASGTAPVWPTPWVWPPRPARQPWGGVQWHPRAPHPSSAVVVVVGALAWPAATQARPGGQAGGRPAIIVG